jgi:hypothetical protein
MRQNRVARCNSDLNRSERRKRRERAEPKAATSGLRKDNPYKMNLAVVLLTARRGNGIFGARTFDIPGPDVDDLRIDLTNCLGITTGDRSKHRVAGAKWSKAERAPERAPGAPGHAALADGFSPATRAQHPARPEVDRGPHLS